MEGNNYLCEPVNSDGVLIMCETVTITSKRFSDLSLEELYGILRVRSEVFVMGQNCLYVDPDGRDFESVQVFASKGEHIIGCLRIYQKEEGILQIGRVAVIESMRGTGIGRMMMRQAISYVTENLTDEKIYLEAQTYAINFYGKLGFKVISDEFLDEGIPHKGMELLIDRASGIMRTDDAAKIKKDKYRLVYKQIEALVAGEDDRIANMSNIAAILHSTFGFWWTGFYVVKGDELVLGPFQGPVACSRIPFGRGVCGTAWKRKESIVVPDVEQFPGHIACSSLSRSEIVVPVFRDGMVVAVLDIDSRELGTFDDIDRENLEKIAGLIQID